MINIIRDNSLDNDKRHIGVVEVTLNGDLKIDRFQSYVNEELDKIKDNGKNYSRDSVFKNNSYYKYFKKFKKTYPVMMQYESFISGREFPMERVLNIIPFLTELETHVLMGAHDADCIDGNLIFYNETEKRPFSGLFNKDAHSYPNDLTGKDDKGIIISMIAGADDRTCLHQNSTHLLYLIFGTEEVSVDTISDMINKVENRIKLLNPEAKIENMIF